MNRIYRLVWNHSLNAFVVSSELASAHGKRTGPSKLAPLSAWSLAGIGGAIALAMAGPVQATDAKLADLQDLVAKYSSTDAQQIVSTALPAVDARASVKAAALLPAVAQVEAVAALSVKATPAAAPVVRARVSAQVAVPKARPQVAGPSLSVVADAALAIKPVAASANAVVTATVGPLAHGTPDLLGLGNILLPGKEEGGSPLQGTLVSTAGAVRELTGEVLTGKPEQAVGTLVTHLHDTVGDVTGQLGGGLGGILQPGGGNGDGLHGALAGTVGAVKQVTGEVLTGKPEQAVGTLVTHLHDTVGDVTGQLGGGLGGILQPGGGNGDGLHGTLAGTVGAVKQVTGEVLGGKPEQAVGTLVTHLQDTVGDVTGQLGGGLGGILQPGGGNGDGLHGALAGTVGAVKQVTGEVLGGKPEQAVGTLVTHLHDTVGDVTGQLGGGLGGILQPGGGNGDGLHGALAGTVGAVKQVTGEVLGGKPEQAVGTLTSHLTTTVTSLTQQAGDGVLGLGGVLLPGGQAGGNPVRDGVTGAVGGVADDLAGGVVKQTGLGGLLNGLVNGVAPVLNGVGDLLGATVGGVTGSTTLGNGVSTTVDTLTGGLKDTTGSLANGDVTGTVQNLLGTVDGTASTLLGSTGTALGGITGAGSGVSGVTNTLGNVIGGVTGGLSNVVGGLTGTPPSTPSAAPTSAGPSGLVVGNGGLVGSVNQLVDSPLSAILGGNGYIENGSLKVNSANILQTYSSLELLGQLPVVNLSPVGDVLNGLGGLSTGSNSHLTLIGGVTSDSYITHINNGDPGGLLGLLLPDGAPGWASDCLDVLGAVQVKCWAVPAAQDYQVLIGDGAFANGSKEVVIGTNAEHRLAAQSADQVFVDAAGGKTGVPTADYDARLGHSVVVGDSAKGTANAQTLLGAGATSDKANSVALGFKSNAARGGQDNYSAFGLTAAQTSIGEVAVGSTGRERQITHVAAGSQDTDAVNVMQLRGALDLINDLDLAAVVYDEDGNGVVNYGKVTLGGGQAPNGTVLANLAAGTVAAGSREAVNGGQLFGMGSALATYLGGGASFSGGVFSAPSYQINTINLQGQASLLSFGDVGAAFSSISDSLFNLSKLPRSGPGGSDPLAVLYTADGGGNATNEVRLAGDGSGAAVAVRNVANGSVSSGSLDAINGGQLAATNDAVAAAIGGTMQFNSSTGQWSAASFNVTAINNAGASTQQTYGNVTDALAAMDGSIVNVNKRIDNIQNGGSGNAYFAVNSTKAAASATGQDSVAAGPAATASGTQAVAVGDGATASANGSVALGAGSVANRANTVSMGNAGAERQITNVADGAEATDAVNVRQLQASQQGTVRYDQNSDGTTNYASVTMGRPGTSTVIHNVATGVAPTDAVNVAQLNKGLGDAMDWSKNYTDQRFNDIGRDIKRVDDRASAGIASAMAMAGLPQPSEAGKRMASFAASTFHGESSMAVGVSGVSDGGRWIYKLSGSANTRGDGGVTVGAGFQW